jgi:hypothetical protein
MINNDLQNTPQKTKDRGTRTPLKTGDELMCSGRVSSYALHCYCNRLNSDKPGRHTVGKHSLIPLGR